MYKDFKTFIFVFSFIGLGLSAHFVDVQAQPAGCRFNAMSDVVCDQDQGESSAAGQIPQNEASPNNDEQPVRAPLQTVIPSFTPPPLVTPEAVDIPDEDVPQVVNSPSSTPSNAPQSAPPPGPFDALVDSLRESGRSFYNLFLSNISLLDFSDPDAQQGAIDAAQNNIDEINETIDATCGDTLRPEDRALLLNSIASLLGSSDGGLVVDIGSLDVSVNSIRARNEERLIAISEALSGVDIEAAPDGVGPDFSAAPTGNVRIDKIRDDLVLIRGGSQTPEFVEEFTQEFASVLRDSGAASVDERVAGALEALSSQDSGSQLNGEFLEYVSDVADAFAGRIRFENNAERLLSAAESLGDLGFTGTDNASVVAELVEALEGLELNGQDNADLIAQTIQDINTLDFSEPDRDAAEDMRRSIEGLIELACRNAEFDDVFTDLGDDLDHQDGEGADGEDSFGEEGNEDDESSSFEEFIETILDTLTGGSPLGGSSGLGGLGGSSGFGGSLTDALGGFLGGGSNGGFGGGSSGGAVGKGSEGMTCALHNAIVAGATQLGMDPSTLAGIIQLESGGSTTIKNPNSTATGLIQFLEATARGLGTSTAALRQMSVEEQMTFVVKYFQSPIAWTQGMTDLQAYQKVHAGSPGRSTADGGTGTQSNTIFNKNVAPLINNYRRNFDWNIRGWRDGVTPASLHTNNCFGAPAASADSFDPRGADQIPGYTRATNTKEVGKFLTSDKGPSHVEGFTNDFSTRLERFLNAAPENIQIYSGYRSPEHQARLFNAAVKKYGSVAAARRWVAPPGRSNHNRGIAADLRYSNNKARQWAHQNARRFGLVFPLSHENWHIEPIGAR